MRIQSSEIPQADVLSDVVRVVDSVHTGAKTFQDIARYINKVGRQGRYYRLAAEILGFIKNERNSARLTPLGNRFVESSQNEKESILLSAVLNARLFQRMIPFFEVHPEGITRTQLEGFLSKVTQPVGPTMLPRRVSTILSWLEDVNVIQHDTGRYKLIRVPEAVAITKFGDYEPLIPKAEDLTEYQTVQSRTRAASTHVSVLINQAATERANRAHSNLVNILAERIRRAGALPRYNSFIDLASRINNRPYIFEMKSLTSRNARTQIRHGLSQLFEYRYIQNLPEAELVLVVERTLPRNVDWMRIYLESDMKIKLIWDGNNQLYASSETQRDMAYLWTG